MSVAVVSFSNGELVVTPPTTDTLVIVTSTLPSSITSTSSPPPRPPSIAVGYERLNEILLANSEAPLSVGTKLILPQSSHEQFTAHVVHRITFSLQQAFVESGLSIDQINPVELIASGVFLPSASTFRVREFRITQYPIKVFWECSESDPNKNTELVLFPRGNAMPSSKCQECPRRSQWRSFVRQAQDTAQLAQEDQAAMEVDGDSQPTDAKEDPNARSRKARPGHRGLQKRLEEYVYDTYSKLKDYCVVYVQPAEKAKLIMLLQRRRLVLLRSAYIARSESLATPSSCAVPRAADDKYLHTNDKDKTAVIEKCATMQKWLKD
ncbi:hypothetical protein OG21DRAFT_1489897 [Imleria badia]|nr:hypothetical protein OG21DRAFT_1489897 [Imleria badia]